MGIQKFKHSIHHISEKEITKKLFYEKFTEEEYNLYKEFSKDKKYCVKLNSWTNENCYSMEKIDILCSLNKSLTTDRDKFNIPKEKYIEALSIYTRIYADCIDFSLNNLSQGKFFLHLDMGLNNIVFTKDLDIKLIDVDSFTITEQIVNSKYIGYYHELIWLVSERLRNV